MIRAQLQAQEGGQDGQSGSAGEMWFIERSNKAERRM